MNKSKAYGRSHIRAQRLETCRTIVRDRHVHTQAELVAALKEYGYEVTQATVSRDIVGLGLSKSKAGYYVLEQDQRRIQLAQTVVVQTDRADNLVVVHTKPGTASSLAAVIDADHDSEVLGTIAGDDTVLVICSDVGAGKRFQQKLDTLLN